MRKAWVRSVPPAIQAFEVLGASPGFCGRMAAQASTQAWECGQDPHLRKHEERLGSLPCDAAQNGGYP